MANAGLARSRLRTAAFVYRQNRRFQYRWVECESPFEGANWFPPLERDVFEGLLKLLCTFVYALETV